MKTTMVYFLAFIVLWSTPAFSWSNYEKIDHAQLFFNDIKSLHLNERLSDVVLVVDNERLYAHKLVLASHSEYFSNLFYGSRKEPEQSVVKISDVSITSFQILLEYTYTGLANLSSLKHEIITELFFVSHYFGFHKFQLSLSEYYRTDINLDNACSLFTGAQIYELKELEEVLLYFIDKNATKVLQSEDFLSLSPVALQQILDRDSFDAYELDIYHAVCNWITNRQGSLDPEFKLNVLTAIRYPLMSDAELKTVARDLQLVDSKTIPDAVQFKETMSPHEFKYRGRPGINFANLSVITSTRTEKMILTTNIILRQPSTINFIEFYLSYTKKEDRRKDVGLYSYHIIVSMDQKDWIPVIDHSKYPCRSTQRVWIYPRTVRYIRIVGTAKLKETQFTIKTIQYNREEMHLVDIKQQLVAPKYNVALKSKNATVIKEYQSSSSAMLEGNYHNVKREYYTRHQLNSGCIVVQLAQPYVLGSMGMLIWDGDGRKIRCTVEASVDNSNWDNVGDVSNELTSSWHLLRFEPRAVVYIRITGVYSSAGEYFYCLQMEAPAQVALNTNVIGVNRDETAESNITVGESSTGAPVD